MDYIFEIDDALSKDFCEDIISHFEQSEEKECVNTFFKKTLDLVLADPVVTRDWMDVINKVCTRVQSSLVEYADYLNDEGLDICGVLSLTLKSNIVTIPEIQKTEKNGFYKWHIDAGDDRCLTYILYLNDIEEGVGGTTEFLCGTNIQPKAGKLLLFPASFTYLQRETKLQEGNKYIITGFTHNKIPESTSSSCNDESEVIPIHTHNVNESNDMQNFKYSISQSENTKYNTRYPI